MITVFFIGLIIGVIVDMAVAMPLIWWHFKRGYWLVNPDVDRQQYLRGLPWPFKARRQED
ncbi:hypothetical protein SEA_BIGSWOLE_11 [Mycobacterium phage Bigswole]|uniref:Uncharacterized protein n=1 Tax=Mycobacterium phage Bigswole TaxID=2041521 RepID=A0A2D1G715_9CAUD|nr:hypothetical protein KHO58_gp011 [Mycobacterium phage Bigswole]ATN87691.1 hypothetical protein SEA_BIGSWOLE_11 [Mycobacterium phage Bigswole]